MPDRVAGRRLVLRGGAIAGGALAVSMWAASGYGWAFWLWGCSVIAYACSFPRARRFSPRPPASSVVWLMAILALALWLRLPEIATTPAFIHVDELTPGVEALHIAQGVAPNVFSSVGWFMMPNLSFAFPALLMTVAGGESFFALRLSSMLMGMAGIVCTYLVARRLLGDRIALVASFLMAVSFWHVHNSRTGFPFVQPSLCTALVLYLLVRGRQDRSRAVLALAGIGLGLSLQCYFPVRILLLLWPLFLLVDWRARGGVRTVAADGATVVGGAVLVLGPLLVSVPWDILAMRSHAILLTQPATLADLARRYRVDGLPAVFLANLVEACRMLTDWALVAAGHRTPHALLDAGTRAALVAGMVIALVSRRAAALRVLAWALLTFALGVVFTDMPRAAYRLTAAMPALFILAALAIDRTLRLLESRHRWGRPAALALLAGFAAWVAMENHRMFFVDYAQASGKDAQSPAAWRFLRSRCEGRSLYILYYNQPRDATMDLFCPAQQALQPADIPGAVDTTRPATFLIGENPPYPVERLLHRCYPGARFTARRGPDERLWFTVVDAAAKDLIAGQGICRAAVPGP